MPALAAGERRRRVAGSSSASQPISSINRCCGSMLAASRGECQKNRRRTDPPLQKAAVPRDHLAGRIGIRGIAAHRETSDRRELGRSRRSPLQSNAGERLRIACTPPGNRSPMPMIAIGSDRAASARASRCPEVADLDQRSLDGADRCVSAGAVRVVMFSLSVSPSASSPPEASLRLPSSDNLSDLWVAASPERDPPAPGRGSPHPRGPRRA